MTDRDDGFELRYEPVTGTPQRIRFEPRTDGRWQLYDEEWTGCCWRTLGHMLVDEVVLEGDADTIREHVE